MHHFMIVFTNMNLPRFLKSWFLIYSWSASQSRYARPRSTRAFGPRCFTRNNQAFLSFWILGRSLVNKLCIRPRFFSVSKGGVLGLHVIMLASLYFRGKIQRKLVPSQNAHKIADGDFWNGLRKTVSRCVKFAFGTNACMLDCVY